MNPWGVHRFSVPSWNTWPCVPSKSVCRVKGPRESSHTSNTKCLGHPQDVGGITNHARILRNLRLRHTHLLHGHTPKDNRLIHLVLEEKTSFNAGTNSPVSFIGMFWANAPCKSPKDMNTSGWNTLSRLVNSRNLSCPVYWNFIILESTTRGSYSSLHLVSLVSGQYPRQVCGAQ